MSAREDDDSDAPEEFTAEQGLQQDEEIRKIQQQNKSRIRREKKERRRKQVERLTPRPKARASERNKSDDEMVEDEVGEEATRQSQVNTGMLPNDIVNLLAAHEKQVFSDSDEEKSDKKSKPKKKKAKKSGVETVILNKLPPAPCVQTSLEFLQKRKTQVARSPAVLNNSNKALRLLSSSGLLK